jgi:hypothetical protein
MLQEIINYPFDELEENDERSDNFDHNVEDVFIEKPNTSDVAITYVNGHHIPDEDDDVEEEDDLVLGDEDELNEDDFDVDEIDVEVDDDIDDVTEDDLVLDADDDSIDEEEDGL